MEQLASQVAFMPIPKPIEHQLAAYHLGTPLEVYQRGWVKDRRVSKLPFLGIILGAIIVGILSLDGFIYDLQTSNTEINILVVVSFFAFMCAVLLTPPLFHPSLCVGAFSEGLMCAKNTRVTVLYWAEIGSCEQKMRKSMYYRVIYSYKIHSRDNKTLKMKIPTHMRVNNLDEIIREHIAVL